MPGRQAKIITATMLRRMLIFVGGTAFTKRDRVIILLSAKAGLRACEIARLDWTMVLDARGHVGAFIAVRDTIAKKRSGRRIPLHGDLRRALISLKGRATPSGPFVREVSIAAIIHPVFWDVSTRLRNLCSTRQSRRHRVPRHCRVHIPRKDRPESSRT
jgi:integrase